VTAAESCSWAPLTTTASGPSMRRPASNCGLPSSTGEPMPIRLRIEAEMASSMSRLWRPIHSSYGP
jgi:hypothetical protein